VSKEVSAFWARKLSAATLKIRFRLRRWAMNSGLEKSQVGAMHYVFPTFGGVIFDAMAG
jgi:hypothetical protein